MYLPPAAVPTSDVGGPDGHSYGVAILPAGDVNVPGLLVELQQVRFTGWIAPPRDGWLVVIGDPGGGVVADGRRGIIEVAELLAKRVNGPVLAVRVKHDRQLGLVAWRAGEEIGRYCSDPSREPGADDDVIARPVGAEYAGAFAELWERMDAADRWPNCSMKRSTPTVCTSPTVCVRCFGCWACPRGWLRPANCRAACPRDPALPS